MLFLTKTVFAQTILFFWISVIICYSRSKLLYLLQNICSLISKKSWIWILILSFPPIFFCRSKDIFCLFIVDFLSLERRFLSFKDLKSLSKTNSKLKKFHHMMQVISPTPKIPWIAPPPPPTTTTTPTPALASKPPTPFPSAPCGIWTHDLSVYIRRC